MASDGMLDSPGMVALRTGSAEIQLFVWSSAKFREQQRCDLWRTQALVPLLGCLPDVHLSDVNRALTLMLRQVVLLLQHLRRSMLNLKGGVVRQPGKKTRRGG